MTELTSINNWQIKIGYYEFQQIQLPFENVKVNDQNSGSQHLAVRDP
jgi:hypothetical protein